MICTKCNERAKPVVCLDIDGTMADYHGHFFKFAAQWLGVPDGEFLGYEGKQDLATWMGVDKRTYREIKLAYRQGGMKRSMPMFPGADSLSQELFEAGVEIWVTTTRPYLRLDNIDPDTREWLHRNEVIFDHLHYDEHKYKTLLDRVHPSRVVAVVDDDPKQIEEAMALGLQTIWRRTPANSLAHLPVGAGLAWQATNLRDVLGMVTKFLTEWKATYDGS